MLALVDQALVSGTNFATAIMVGRYSSESQLGDYQNAFSALVMLGVLQASTVLVPYTVYSSRMHGSERRYYSGSVFVHHALLSILAAAMLASLAAVIRLSHLGLGNTLYCLAAITPLVLLREFSRRFEFASMNFRSAIFVDGGVGLIQILILLFFGLQGQLSAAMAVGICGAANGLVGVVWLVRNYGEFRFQGKMIAAHFWKNFSFAKWGAAGHLTGTLRQASMPWIITSTLGSHATGIYAACLTVNLLANPMILGIGNILTPLTARSYASGGHAKLRRVVFQVFALLAVGLGLFVLSVFFWGESVVALAYNRPEYAGQGLTIATLALAITATALGHPFSEGLRSLERPEVYFFSALTGVAIGAPCSFFLAWRFGVAGASAGFLIGNAVATTFLIACFLYQSHFDRETKG